MHTHCVMLAYLYCFCAHNHATTRDHKNSTTRDLTFQAGVWLRKPYQLPTSKTKAWLCKSCHFVLFAHTSQWFNFTGSRISTSTRIVSCLLIYIALFAHTTTHTNSTTRDMCIPSLCMCKPSLSWRGCVVVSCRLQECIHYVLATRNASLPHTTTQLHDHNNSTTRDHGMLACTRIW